MRKAYTQKKHTNQVQTHKFQVLLKYSKHIVGLNRQLKRSEKY